MRKASLLFAVFFFLLFVEGCGPTATPTPLPTPTPTCNASQYLKDAINLWDKFLDTEKRAGATPRASLSPVIGELQQIRRDFRALQAPPCALASQLADIAVMDNYIEGYLSFLKNDPDSVVKVYFQYADKYIAVAFDEREKLNDEMGLPRAPTRTPTVTPLQTDTPMPTITVLAILPKPTATVHSTETPALSLVRVGTRVYANGFGWNVSKVDFVKTLESDHASDTRTAKGVYLIVVMDLDWDDSKLVHSYGGVTEFEVISAGDRRFSFEGFPQAQTAELKYITDDSKHHMYYSRANNPTPYPKNKVLQDVIVYDVPNDGTGLYLRRVGYPSQLVILR